MSNLSEWIPQRADPYVLHHTDGLYYFTATVPTYDRIVLRRAASLEKLKNAPEICIWTAHETGQMATHIWAPELHWIDGAWYVYFAAGEREDVWAIRPYVLRCTGADPLADAWEELGMMRAAEDFSFRDFSLDMTTFVHRGKRYAVWAEKVGHGKKISNLYIAEMKSPTELATAQVLLTTPDYDWERVDFWVNEGPSFLAHGGKVHIAFSASATGACYCMGLMTADADADLLDPKSWTKSRHPVLTTNETVGLYGPGHNSFTRDAEGDIMVFHARTYEKIEGDPLDDPNRHAWLMRVQWDGDMPVFDYRNLMNV